MKIEYLPLMPDKLYKTVEDDIGTINALRQTNCKIKLNLNPEYFKDEAEYNSFCSIITGISYDVGIIITIHNGVIIIDNSIQNIMDLCFICDDIMFGFEFKDHIQTIFNVIKCRLSEIVPSIDKFYDMSDCKILKVPDLIEEVIIFPSLDMLFRVYGKLPSPDEVHLGSCHSVKKRLFKDDIHYITVSPLTRHTLKTAAECHDTERHSPIHIMYGMDMILSTQGINVVSTIMSNLEDKDIVPGDNFTIVVEDLKEYWNTIQNDPNIDPHDFLKSVLIANTVRAETKKGTKQ